MLVNFLRRDATDKSTYLEKVFLIARPKTRKDLPVTNGHHQAADQTWLDGKTDVQTLASGRELLERFVQRLLVLLGERLNGMIK